MNNGVRITVNFITAIILTFLLVYLISSLLDRMDNRVLNVQKQQALTRTIENINQASKYAQFNNVNKLPSKEIRENGLEQIGLYAQFKDIDKLQYWKKVKEEELEQIMAKESANNKPAAFESILIWLLGVIFTKVISDLIDQVRPAFFRSVLKLWDKLRLIIRKDV